MKDKSQILVTGAAGFIGSNLVKRLLEKGFTVIGLDNFDPFYSREIKENNLSQFKNRETFKFYESDLLDIDSMNSIFQKNKISKVVHLAAKAGVRPSIQDPKGYFETNVTGTVNLLDAMVKNDIKKLVFASSSSVYGNNKKVPFSENDIVDFPISPYAASKKSGELICHTYHHLYDMDIFALRFFTVYGPRQRPEMAIAKFANKILNDEEITLYDKAGSTSRDYTYIDDIVDGIYSCIENVSGFEVLNLGESQVVGLNQLVKTLEKHLRKKAKVVYADKQPGDVNITYADISKAKKLINYNPSTKIEEGIKKYCSWLLNELESTNG
ncbi:MAG: SDR family NAD(P)-dependent oxidoreductase [Ignavibacteriae bacterium]|nr:SDR family NAD(P)-dependent oxidoreductase [Ignavibacteriota bacterium]NOH00041.1 SDR family NAD(P)-dependent oxidoreductase [Ignavibacteriota bacterium]